MNDPRVTMDSGHPIQGVTTPPAEPAAQPSYGPSPTAQGVRGYRDLPADDVALINAVKELQENVADVWATIFLREGTDRRWANIAKTHLEEGISALVRSIAKPHDPFAAALERLGLDAMQRLGERLTDAAKSTQEQNLAQPSHDHHPDDGSRA